MDYKHWLWSIDRGGEVIFQILLTGGKGTCDFVSVSVSQCNERLNQTINTFWPNGVIIWALISQQGTLNWTSWKKCPCAFLWIWWIFYHNSAQMGEWWLFEITLPIHSGQRQAGKGLKRYEIGQWAQGYCPWLPITQPRSGPDTKETPVKHLSLCFTPSSSLEYQWETKSHD